MVNVTRQVRRDVKREREAKMALRWIAAGLFEAKRGFRRINAYKQSPLLKQALSDLRQKHHMVKEVA